MFDNEEEKLAKWKRAIEKTDAPQDKLEWAIQQGFQRAKNAQKMTKRPYVKRGIWSLVAAVILVIAFATSIRVSPAIANAVAALPGMEKIVHLIQDNKGLMSAIDNEYYQALQVSAEKEGITLTIDGVIADDQEIVIFHTVKGASKYASFPLLVPELLDTEGNIIAESVSAMSDSEEIDGGTVQTTGRSHIRFIDGFDGNEFILKATIKSQSRTIDYEIPFSLIKEKMPTTRYPINETVAIEGQKVTIQHIEISPVKVSVHVKMDPENTMEIFAFEDLRLVDDKGETWTSISDGVVAMSPAEHEEIIYLQSNYFEQPTTLTLMINRLQALAKEEAYIVVDTEKGVILEQPADQRFSVSHLTDKSIEFSLRGEKGYSSLPFLSGFIDAEGREFDESGGVYRKESDELIKISEVFPDEPFVNPIKLPLVSYPQWIEGEVKIKIK